MGKGKLLARQVGSWSKARHGTGSQGPEVWKSSQALVDGEGDILAGPTAAQPLLPSFAIIAHSVLCHCAEGACVPTFFVQEAPWFWGQLDPTRPSAPKSLS